MYSLHKLKNIFILTGIVLMSYTNLAQAHEFILKPDMAYDIPQGQAIQIQAQAAHVFMKSDEVEKINNVEVFLQQGENSTKVQLVEDNNLKSLVGRIKLENTKPAMLVGHRLSEIWSETTEGILQGTKQALMAEGKKVRSSTSYQKFAKTLLNPSELDIIYKKSIGQTLEFILLDNPATLELGQKMTAQLLFNSTPIQANISISYDGYSQEEKYLYELESDENGKVSFAIPNAGLWFVRAEVINKLDSKVTATTGVDYESYRATYIFPIISK